MALENSWYSRLYYKQHEWIKNCEVNKSSPVRVMNCTALSLVNDSRKSTLWLMKRCVYPKNLWNTVFCLCLSWPKSWLMKRERRMWQASSRLDPIMILSYTMSCRWRGFWRAGFIVTVVLIFRRLRAAPFYQLISLLVLKEIRRRRTDSESELSVKRTLPPSSSFRRIHLT